MSRKKRPFQDLSLKSIFYYEDGKVSAQFFCPDLQETHWQDAIQWTKSDFCKVKTNSLVEPFQSFIRFADFTLRIRENLPSSSTIIIYLTGSPAILFYLIKEIIWLGNEINIRIKFKVNSESSNNPLIKYMQMFTVGFFPIIQSETEEKNLKELDLNKLAGLDVSEQMSIQNNFLTGNENAKNKVIEKTKKKLKKNHLNVDVIIPVRNTPLREVRKAIASVECQLQVNDSIIVVDDNDVPSKDLSNLANNNSRLTYLRGPVKGVAEARNCGLNASASELVAFIDSDDYVSVNFIQPQREFHMRNREVAATGTWIQAFGSHQTVYPQWDNLQLFGMFYCLPPAGVLMWKSSIIKEELGGFDAKFERGFEDFDLVIRAGLIKRAIVVRERVDYFYQRGHASLTQKWSVEELHESRMRVLANAQCLSTNEFQIFIKILENFGIHLSDIPIDVFSHKWEERLNIPLFTYVLARFRNKGAVRSKWRFLPLRVRFIVISLTRILCNFIDFISQKRWGKILRRLYRNPVQ